MFTRLGTFRFGGHAGFKESTGACTGGCGGRRMAPRTARFQAIHKPISFENCLVPMGNSGPMACLGPRRAALCAKKRYSPSARMVVLYALPTLLPGVGGPSCPLERGCKSLHTVPVACPALVALNLVTQLNSEKGAQVKRRWGAPSEKGPQSFPTWIRGQEDGGGGGVIEGCVQASRPTSTPYTAQNKEGRTGKESLWLLEPLVRKIILHIDTPTRSSLCRSQQT